MKPFSPRLLTKKHIMFVKIRTKLMSDINFTLKILLFKALDYYCILKILRLRLLIIYVMLKVTKRMQIPIFKDFLYVFQIANKAKHWTAMSMY